MTDWKKIHPDFNEEWQRKWEELGFTYQTAQEWIQIKFNLITTTRFEPQHCHWVKEWVNHNFTPRQTYLWIDSGMGLNRAEFAAYLRSKGYKPNPNFDFTLLKQLREEFRIWKDNLLLKDKLERQEKQNQELKNEIVIEREEMEKFRQKSEEWSKRQAEQKEKEIEELKKQVKQLQAQLVNLQVGEQQAQIQILPKNN